MLTAISAVIGFLGSIVPAILKMFQQKQDNKHELAMIEAQVNAQKILGQQRIEEAGIKADIDETVAILKAAETKTTGIKIIDGIIEIANALMRPVVVYCYFFEYLIIKYATYTLLRSTQAMDWASAIEYLWTDFDKAMFGGIMGFLFGNRSVGHWFDRLKK